MPSAPVPEDPVDQALKELIMGNGPPLDDGPASPLQSDERAAFSPETATKEAGHAVARAFRLVFSVFC